MHPWAELNGGMEYWYFEGTDFYHNYFNSVINLILALIQIVYFSKNDAKDFTKYPHGNKMRYLTCTFI